MVPFLTILSGLAWTVVYIEAIRVGFKDKTYAMPIVALALNFAWESTYAVHDLVTSVSIQAYVNFAWALADLAIVFTFLKFGRSELPGFVTRAMFAAWAMLIFSVSFAVQWLFLVEFAFPPSLALFCVSTKPVYVGSICADGNCTTGPSRAETHDRSLEVACDFCSNHSVWGDRRVALHPWSWHTLFCV